MLSPDSNQILAYLGVLALSSAGALADGSTIDKVYQPYVEQQEWELEWRMTHENENPASGEERRQVHRLGLGHAFSEYLFAELYLIGDRSSDQSLDISAYELELLWQLSEQGEYFLDYGLLFELEKEDNEDVWEYSTALLLEKEFGRYSGTANVGLIYEWGDDIQDELESALTMQGRYRYSPRLEPAVELYIGENTLGLGPVLMGVERTAQMQAVRWEAGIIFGMDSDTADYTFRAVLEYEF
jgi:hypothetical protein